VKQDQTRAAGAWLAGEIEKMRARVADAEAKVEEYRQRANLFAGSNNTSLPSQQLTEINSQIAAARGQKADIDARARQLRDLMGSGKSIDSADTTNSDTMRRLIEQRIAVRAQLAEQSTTLLDQHPRIKELKAQLAEIDRQIQVEGERLLRQLDNDANVASDRLATLTASLDQVKKLASQTSEQDVQLRALEREAKTQRDLLESYLVKYREASARDSINAAPPEARIISRATPAVKPSYPMKLPIVLIAAFAAFSLSAGFTVMGALLTTPPAYAYEQPVQYARTTASFVQSPLMSPRASPPVPTPVQRVTAPPLAPADEQASDDPAPPLVVNAVDRIARTLRQAEDVQGRSIVVVGTVRNVGTTFAAIMLARTLAHDANVVLVDLAFSAPNLSVISTDPNAPGIAELANGTASFGEIITRDQYSPVHLVATGNVGADPAALVSSPVLATAIEAMAHTYDYVVIDMGAASDVAADRFVALASRAMLVAADPMSAVTRSVHDRLLHAGFQQVMVVAGGSQAAAA